MADTIFRKPTTNDKNYFDIDLNRPKRIKTPQQKFEEELSKKEIEASKKGLPFARKPAREDFQNAIQSQVNQQVREYGRVEYPEQIKLPNIEWDKYSNLDNFELIEEGERFDEYLSKINPGLHVMAKAKKYKYKGYGDTYTVMEDGPSSIMRAKEKAAKENKEIEKSINSGGKNDKTNNK